MPLPQTWIPSNNKQKQSGEVVWENYIIAHYTVSVMWKERDFQFLKLAIMYFL